MTEKVTEIKKIINFYELSKDEMRSLMGFLGGKIGRKTAITPEHQARLQAAIRAAREKRKKQS